MFRTYLVEFCYHTDCRTELEIESANEVFALAHALQEISISKEGWVTSKEFFVKISLLRDWH